MLKGKMKATPGRPKVAKVPSRRRTKTWQLPRGSTYKPEILPASLMLNGTTDVECFGANVMMVPSAMRKNPRVLLLGPYVPVTSPAELIARGLSILSGLNEESGKGAVWSPHEAVVQLTGVNVRARNLSTRVDAAGPGRSRTRRIETSYGAIWVSQEAVERAGRGVKACNHAGRVYALGHGLSRPRRVEGDDVPVRSTQETVKHLAPKKVSRNPSCKVDAQRIGESRARRVDSSKAAVRGTQKTA